MDNRIIPPFSFHSNFVIPESNKRYIFMDRIGLMGSEIGQIFLHEISFMYDFSPLPW